MYFKVMYINYNNDALHNALIYCCNLAVVKNLHYLFLESCFGGKAEYVC